MNIQKPAGIDADGYILTVADGPIQPEFQPLLTDVCATLSRPEFGLHGIYLYGSIARGEGEIGTSDLDLSLILIEPPDAPVLEQLESARLALEQRHPHVTKIDFDIGHRAQVLAPENLNSWGFWLKHHCRCLWGEDLSLHFQPFRPSRAIALAVNGDFEQALTAYLVRIELASTEHTRYRLQREAARALIRATHTLRAEDAQIWPHTLEEYVGLFALHYPNMRVQIAYFLFEARNPSAEREVFTTRLRAFLSWLVAAQ
ncbi:nucleotidyltransferase domain-containing protein [Pseudomonas carnis]|uniref:nucleotidyltransferase domain-containing protein n=1 Tax=Pseudomonas carnis TaxID=2487355 RepID=UPI0018E647E2|nr:nucleotidyltransferase domain-containing protein [Pseudomonas carnis]MBI6664018.1 nucleotidyltransferase domain-containing protein [Pseudomonas carnis]MBI6686648.1 nucleotidyltransferase domain-containing protein [Pseudomonas carnis]